MHKSKFIFILFYSLFGFHSFYLQSQEDSTITFKQFVYLMEQKDNDKYMQIDDSLYLEYLNDTPFVNDESDMTFLVLFTREAFVAIVKTTTLEMGRSETSILSTYDREGKLIAEFDFGSGIFGDYYSESRVCEISASEAITCKLQINEGGLEEELDEEGNIIGMNYITVKDETTYEYFRIMGNGTFERIEPEIYGD